MNKGYGTWLVLVILYVICCGLMYVGVFPALLFFAGQYQVLRREMKLQENKKTYLYIAIGLSGLFLVPLLNGGNFYGDGMDNIIGVGNILYLCIFYYLQKYFLSYDNQNSILNTKAKNGPKSTFIDKLVIIVPMGAYLLLLLWSFISKY